MMGLCCVILIGSVAQSQSTDWQSVKRIHPGTRISVKTRLRSICDFITATDETLVCEAAHPGLIPIPQFRLERNKVREVRLEHSDTTNNAVGAAVGGSVGAAGGAMAANKTLTRGGGALLVGDIGVLIGGSMGEIFPITHGAVVYRRSKAANQIHPPTVPKK
jgi:hypothetical protein